MAWKKIYTIALFVNALLIATLQYLWMDLQSIKETNVSIDASRKLPNNHDIECFPVKRKNVDCQKVMIGDSQHLKEIEEMETIKQDSKCSLHVLSRNCSRLMSAHKYILSDISEEERDFPLAFTLKMHKDSEQAEQLLRIIYRPHNVYCIYIDAKANTSVYNTMKQLSECFDNVHVIKKRIDVVYASIAHVQSELQCMQACIRSKVNWKYYINLTGQEFPLRTNLEMVSILKLLNGTNDIESYNHPFHQQWRHKTKFEILGHINIDTTVPKEPFKYSNSISKGSAYGLFSREFVQFILSDDVARSFISWLSDTHSPEENAWATLNTLPWAPGGIETEIRHTRDTFLARAVNWQTDNTECHGQYVRGVCVYGAGDLQWLISRKQFIANKFNTDIDSVPIDCLEEEIRKRTSNPEIHRLDWYYYRHLPQISESKIHIYGRFGYEFRQKRKKKWLEKHNHRNVKNSNKLFTEQKRLGQRHTANMFYVYSNGTIRR